MKDRTRKAFAPILAASILLYSPAAFALRGGPFDNGQVSGATAGGTYAGVISGNNLMGLVQFGISDVGESNGRFAIFHEGIMHYGVCMAVADATNGSIAGAFLGVAPLPDETTGHSATPGTTFQSMTVRTGAEGEFQAEMKDYPVNISFHGDGELSTVANPVTITNDIAGSNVVVNAGGTADNGGATDPQSTQAVSPTTINGTTVRARTPFEIRGSRTSLTQFSPLNSFAGVPPIDPGGAQSTPIPGLGTPTP